MSGLLGLGGSSAKTDRKAQLQGFGDLSSIYNTGMPFAKAGMTSGTATQGKGLDTLQGVKDYWQSILGSRSGAMRAAQPEVNSTEAAGDLARKNLAAEGTARGGGVNATSQAAEFQRRGQVEDSIAKTQPTAAGELGKVGSEISSIGSQQIAQALQAMGLGEYAAEGLTQNAQAARNTDIQSQTDMGKAAGNAAAALIGLL